MKKHLDQLTMAQFIELVSGDTEILLSKGELVSREKVARVARKIIYDYHTIADPTGTRQRLAQKGKEVKARISFIVFTICDNLVAAGEHDRVREVMKEYGIDTSSMNDQRVTAEVRSRLERTRRTIAEIEEARDTKDIDLSVLRASFDEQTASLMAHFKFQIDITKMKATLYAHLVARHDREIKAELSAMRKMRT